MRPLIPLLVALAALALPAAPASAVTTAVDGPSAGIPATQTVKVDMAPDGTAAVAYLKSDHVYVSRYAGGAWTAPARVDTGLDTHPSHNPSVAVANGGKVVVTFANGAALPTKLYSAIKPSSSAPFGAPAVLHGDNAGNYADVDLAPGGSGYAALGLAVGANHDVYAKRLQGTTWTPVGADFPDAAAGALDQSAAVDSSGEPGDQRGARVAVAADGQSAVVAFTEEENVGDYDVVARRLTGTTRGPAAEAEVASFGGFAASSAGADMADVDMDGAGTAWVVMRQGITYGATDHPRCLARPLTGNTFGEPRLLDALPTPPGADACEFPRIDVTAGGLGLAASYHQMTFHADAATLAGGTWGTPFQVSLVKPEAPARTAVALGDQGSGLIAWRHDPGGGGAKEILARARLDTLRGQVTLSNPAFGSVDTSGLEAAADAGTRAVVAFTQGAAANTRLVAAVVDLPQRPGPPPPGGDDTTPPVVSDLALSPRRFRVGRKLATAAAVKRRTRIRYALSEAATVVARFARAAPGRKAGGRCVKPRRSNRSRPRCTRFKAVKPKLSFAGQQAGARTIRFAGRLTEERSLRPGRHRLTLRARDAAGNLSEPAKATFKVLRKR